MTRLERYVAITTLRALLLVSAALTILFSLLELINQLHDVGKGNYRLIDACVYVLLTAPARLLQLMPAAMLFACLFALGALATRAELTVMRASGISPNLIVGAVFKLALAVLVALFALAQFVIPPAQQLAQAERDSRLASLDAVRGSNSFWAAGEHQFLNVRRFADANIPVDIYLYEFSAGGDVQGVIQASRAEVRPDGTWLLERVSRKRFSGAQIDTEQLRTLVWHSFLRPAQVSLLTLPADSMRPLDLYRYVRDLQRRHEPAARYSQELWEKIDLPFAMAAMMLIAIPFAFGSLRTWGMGQRMMIGTMIGIIFTLVQQITSYLGLLLHVYPALTVMTPSIALAALGVYLFRRAV
jgi:lipopolysaccharide export system permease protein